MDTEEQLRRLTERLDEQHARILQLERQLSELTERQADRAQVRKAAEAVRRSAAKEPARPKPSSSPSADWVGAALEIETGAPSSAASTTTPTSSTGPTRVARKASAPRPRRPAFPFKLPRQLGSKAEFTSEEEYRESKRRKKSKPETSLEMRFATVWLPWIGGPLLILGAVWLGAQAIPYLSIPARVFIAYALSVALGGAGFFVKKRVELLGRVTIAISGALAYFVSFGAHFLEPMRVFASAWPSILLMVASAGFTFGLAERWKSQAAAAMAFILGVLAALLSAQTSQHFSLLALVILAAGAGVLLVRHEWKALTALSLAGIYISMPILWLIEPVGQSTPVAYVHLGALAIYHTIFALAFWKWGRIWVARERAMEEAPEELGIPRMDTGLLPYSTSFGIINSLGFAALAIWLFWYSPDIHWLLFGLAAVEVIHLSVPGLRRGYLLSFHVLSGLALLSAGLVSAFSGMTQSAVLAAETLILVIAASRSRSLYWLRPLSFITAFMTVHEFDVTGKAVELFSPLLLLLSTLRWEAIWVRRPQRLGRSVFAVFDGLSSVSRATLATMMAAAGLIEIVEAFGPGVPSHPAFATALLSLLLVLGVALLGAHSWHIGATLAAAATLIIYAVDGGSSPFAYAAAAILGFWFIAFLLVYDSIHARSRKPHEVGWYVVSVGLLTILAPFAFARFIDQVAVSVPDGLGFFFFTLVLLAMIHAGKLLPRLPLLVQMPEPPSEDEGKNSLLFRQLSLPPVWTHARLCTTSFLVTAGVSIVLSAFQDARFSLLSSVIITVTVFGGWVYFSFVQRKKVWWHEWLPSVALAAMIPAFLVYSDTRSWGFLSSGVLAAGLMAFSLWANRRVPALTGAVALLLTCAVLGLIIGSPVNGTGDDPFTGLVFGILLVGGSLLCHQALVRWPVSRWSATAKISEWTVASWVLTLGGTLSGLWFLSMESLVPSPLTTASWGLWGIALLIAGLALRKAVWRYAGFGVLAAAVARVFFSDMANATPLAKGVAAFAVGLILLACALLYGFIRRKQSQAGAV